MNWLEIVVAILSGMATCLPLVVRLVHYIKVALKEREWSRLLSFAAEAMSMAETMYDKGIDKKDFVMAEVRKLAERLDYPLDEEEFSELIDQLCLMSKTVNIKALDKSGG